MPNCAMKPANTRKKRTLVKKPDSTCSGGGGLGTRAHAERGGERGRGEREGRRRQQPAREREEETG